MKKPRKIIWKMYFVIFSTMTIANLVWLLNPEADPYKFYHILMAWSDFYLIHYSWAFLKCIVGIISLIPLFNFSFNRTTKIPRFWQWILAARIICDIFGHFYEYMFIKASYHMVLGYGLATTGSFILPIIPSYLANYFYAFQKNIK